jgi:putative transposase
MKKTKFMESQIFNLLKEAEMGISIADICREQLVTLHSTNGELNTVEWASMMKRLKELEEENQRLKCMHAHAAMDNQILKETLKKL